MTAGEPKAISRAATGLAGTAGSAPKSTGRTTKGVDKSPWWSHAPSSRFSTAFRSSVVAKPAYIVPSDLYIRTINRKASFNVDTSPASTVLVKVTVMPMGQFLEYSSPALAGIA